LAAPAPTTHLSVVLPPDLVVAGIPKLDSTGRILLVRARPRTAADGEWRIYRRPLDRAELYPIPGTERAIGFRPLADGRVFFLATLPGEETTRGFTVPLDGQGPPSPLFSMPPTFNFYQPLEDGSFV